MARITRCKVLFFERYIVLLKSCLPVKSIELTCGKQLLSRKFAVMLKGYTILYSDGLILIHS